MPYQVSWYTENAIILYVYDGVMTLDDLTQSNCDALELMNTATQKIDFLVDLRFVKKVAFSANEMMTVKCLTDMVSHPLNNWTAYYDKRSSFAQLLIHIIHQSVSGRARFFDSHDEALEFLNSLHPAS